MNSLKTYWLSRVPGADAEGPLTLGQLKDMWQTGAINAEAQVCLNGDEEWTEARWMLEADEEPMPVVSATVHRSLPGKAVRKRLSYGGCGLLILSFGAGYINPLLGVGFFLLALIVDFMSVKTVCSECGNEVVKTSRECPACKASLK